MFTPWPQDRIQLVDKSSKSALELFTTTEGHYGYSVGGVRANLDLTAAELIDMGVARYVPALAETPWKQAGVSFESTLRRTILRDYRGGKGCYILVENGACFSCNEYALLEAGIATPTAKLRTSIDKSLSKKISQLKACTWPKDDIILTPTPRYTISKGSTAGTYLVKSDIITLSYSKERLLLSGLAQPIEDAVALLRGDAISAKAKRESINEQEVVSRLLHNLTLLHVPTYKLTISDAITIHEAYYRQFEEVGKPILLTYLEESKALLLSMADILAAEISKSQSDEDARYALLSTSVTKRLADIQKSYLFSLNSYLAWVILDTSFSIQTTLSEVDRATNYNNEILKKILALTADKKTEARSLLSGISATSPAEGAMATIHDAHRKLMLEVDDYVEDLKAHGIKTSIITDLFDDLLSACQQKLELVATPRVDTKTISDEISNAERVMAEKEQQAINTLNGISARLSDYRQYVIPFNDFVRLGNTAFLLPYIDEQKRQANIARMARRMLPRNRTPHRRHNLIFGSSHLYLIARDRKHSYAIYNGRSWWRGLYPLDLVRMGIAFFEINA